MVEEYPISEEDKAEEDIERNVEIQTEAQKEAFDESPTYSPKEDLYSFFWKVVKTTDSTKVANLDPKTELGLLNMTVRDCQNIKLLAETLGHKGFGNFFGGRAEIILATSASKKGWLLESAITQRKFTSKEKITPQQMTQSSQPVKKGFFARWRKTE